MSYDNLRHKEDQVKKLREKEREISDAILELRREEQNELRKVQDEYERKHSDLERELSRTQNEIGQQERELERLREEAENTSH